MNSNDATEQGFVPYPYVGIKFTTENEIAMNIDRFDLVIIEMGIANGTDTPEEFTCTWQEFVAANEDEDIDAIRAALNRGDYYSGGGGASEYWTVRRDYYGMVYLESHGVFVRMRGGSLYSAPATTECVPDMDNYGRVTCVTAKSEADGHEFLGDVNGIFGTSFTLADFAGR